MTDEVKKGLFIAAGIGVAAAFLLAKKAYAAAPTGSEQASSDSSSDASTDSSGLPCMTVRITTQSDNLSARSSPSRSAVAVGSYAPGSTVEIDGARQGDLVTNGSTSTDVWYSVKGSNGAMWISSAYAACV
jgi:hypothetical protein